MAVIFSSPRYSLGFKYTNLASASKSKTLNYINSGSEGYTAAQLDSFARQVVEAFGGAFTGASRTAQYDIYDDGEEG